MPAVSLALDDLPTREFGAQVVLRPGKYARLTDETRAEAEGMPRRVLERLGCGALCANDWQFSEAWTDDEGREYPALWTYSVTGMRPHTDHPPKDAVTREFERLGFHLWETPR